MKNMLEEIEKERQACGLLDIKKGKNGRIILEKEPKPGACGFYWLYTDYTLDDLCNANYSPKKGAIKIPLLSQDRKCLKNIIKQSNNDFWIVYNGIGGRKETTNKNKSYGLASRIRQEFANHEKTGSLKILGSTLNDLSKWKYSYVEISCEKYQKYKNAIEMGWRLEYNHPILSTH